ncbi:MAG: RNA methyltransferase [Asgard group archaeon]|nr:RNA methyltransferase [Asgard group archaeon]
MTIKIVLVEPLTAGNIGSTARVMKNFGFQKLVLINPQTELTSEAYQFAVHANDILENLEIYNSLSDFLETVTYVVGTTAKICTDRGSTNARVAISSDDPKLKNLLEFKDDIAILFGREDIGLTNDEINLCDMTIHIPTVEEYKALNLAQAVTIILYSIHVLRKKTKITDYREAKKEEKELLLEWFAKVVSLLGFHKRKEALLNRRFRNIIGRAFVSGKEAYSLVGVFSRSYNKIMEYNKQLKKENNQ